VGLRQTSARSTIAHVVFGHRRVHLVCVIQHHVGVVCVSSVTPRWLAMLVDAMRFTPCRWMFRADALGLKVMGVGRGVVHCNYDILDSLHVFWCRVVGYLWNHVGESVVNRGGEKR